MKLVPYKEYMIKMYLGRYMDTTSEVHDLLEGILENYGTGSVSLFAPTTKQSMQMDILDLKVHSSISARTLIDKFKLFDPYRVSVFIDGIEYKLKENPKEIDKKKMKRSYRKKLDDFKK